MSADKLKVLVVGEQARRYADHFSELFPEAIITPIIRWGDAPTSVTDAQAVWAPPSKVSLEMLKGLPRLRWLQGLAAGTDPILAHGPALSDIIVTSLSGVHAPQMSELALLLMMSLQRQFPAMLLNQKNNIWNNWPQPILAGKTITIVGLGAIAMRVASVCKIFGMTVVGVSDGRRQAENFDNIVLRRELIASIGDTDFLLLLVPLTASTRALIGKDVLAALPSRAFVINLSRGAVIDEAALIAALQKGEIAGAGLDVFTQEPLPGSSPLWQMPNVIVTPHVGGFSDVLFDQSVPLLSQNLRAFLDGDLRLLRNVVPLPTV